jgi:hypothetical protein
MTAPRPGSPDVPEVPGLLGAPEPRDAGRPPTVLTYPGRDVAWTYGLLVGGGAALGATVHLLRGWLLSLDVLPWRGVLVTVDRVVDGWGAWGTVALVAAGALLGFVVATGEVEKEPRFEVSPERVVVVRGRRRRTYRREDVREALHEDGALVLLATNGTELARTATGIPAPDLERALRAAGYVWDPHA